MCVDPLVALAVNLMVHAKALQAKCAERIEFWKWIADRRGELSKAWRNDWCEAVAYNDREALMARDTLTYYRAEFVACLDAVMMDLECNRHREAFEKAREFRDRMKG